MELDDVAPRFCSTAIVIVAVRRSCLSLRKLRKVTAISPGPAQVIQYFFYSFFFFFFTGDAPYLSLRATRYDGLQHRRGSSVLFPR